MLNPFFALLLPPLLLVPAMGLLSAVESHSPLETEVRRKAFHISIGLASLAFPLFLTESWMVFIALSLAAIWMATVRKLPAMNRRFGRVLHDTDRDSQGEQYFALSIATLLLASNGDSALYVIPILILTIADTFAAIVGRAIPLGPLTGIGSGKTTSGSVAFFAAAALVTLPTLIGLTDLSLQMAIVATITVSAGTCVAEAISSRGFDNLAVPVVALAILKLFVIGAW
jgi:dolichol kinase